MTTPKGTRQTEGIVALEGERMVSEEEYAMRPLSYFDRCPDCGRTLKEDWEEKLEALGAIIARLREGVDLMAGRFRSPRAVDDDIRSGMFKGFEMSYLPRLQETEDKYLERVLSAEAGLGRNRRRVRSCEYAFARAFFAMAKQLGDIWSAAILLPEKKLGRQAHEYLKQTVDLLEKKQAECETLYGMAIDAFIGEVAEDAAIVEEMKEAGHAITDELRCPNPDCGAPLTENDSIVIEMTARSNVTGTVDEELRLRLRSSEKTKKNVRLALAPVGQCATCGWEIHIEPLQFDAEIDKG